MKLVVDFIPWYFNSLTMKHKMIHYRGYFLLALAFMGTGAFVGTENPDAGLPLGFVGVVFWLVGSTKVALRNAQVKSPANP